MVRLVEGCACMSIVDDVGEAARMHAGGTALSTAWTNAEAFRSVHAAAVLGRCDQMMSVTLCQLRLCRAHFIDSYLYDCVLLEAYQFMKLP